jgi:hypothetical protein
MRMSLAQILRYNALAVELQARERLEAIADAAVQWMEAGDRREHIDALRTAAGFRKAGTPPAGVRVISGDSVRTFLRGKR